MTPTTPQNSQNDVFFTPVVYRQLSIQPDSPSDHSFFTSDTGVDNRPSYTGGQEANQEDSNNNLSWSRTVTWQEVSEWQLDNKYILSGYRPEKADYLEIFTSLTFLHNETCNVYTHLVGALLLPLVATVFLRNLAKP
jgi:hypothetical protein